MNDTEAALERFGAGLEHFYVAERSRVLYIRVPKAACTTMLWGLLEWEGHDPSMMDRSRNALLSTPDVVVHDMNLYPIPTLADVTPALRRNALTSPGWLRVAVVRNPYARLYSAWESKVLTVPPANKRFDGAPDLVENEQGVDVGASFRSFVLALSEQPERWMSERHFIRQVDLVPTAVINDIEIVPTGAVSDLFGRLSDRAGVTVTPRRSNEGLGMNATTLLDDETAERITRLYALDFELTGTDPTDYALGEPIFLNSMALGLLRLAGARSDRTVQLNRTYRQAQNSRTGKVVHGVARRFTRR